MNKRISEWMNDAAEDIDMTDPGLFDAGRVTARVREKLRAEQKPARPRRIWRTVLIAAIVTALIAAMSVTAAAGGARVIVDGVLRFFGKTEIYTPGEGEIFVETGTGENEGWSAARDDIAMILRYDVPKESHEVVVKANWLPEEPNYIYPLSVLAQSRDSFEQELAARLREAGTPPEEEWSEWNTGWFYRSREGEILWELQLFTGERLYRRDLTLGQYGGEATVEREWTEGGFECMEITLDYSTSRNPAVANRGVYRHLLMFNEKDGYLLNFCGTEAFETFEKLAENLEICVTPVTATAPEPVEGVWNYMLLDAGQG